MRMLSYTAIAGATVCLVAACGSSSAPIVTTCSNASLHGAYGFQRNGQMAPGSPFTAVGLVTFDGQGGSVLRQTTSASGKFSTATDQAERYAINADCTGTETDATGATITKLIVVNNGDHVDAMSLVPGSNLAGHYERLSGNCSNATLNGTYGFERNGVTSAGSLLAIGYATFDGKGTWVAQQTISRNGAITTPAQQSGTYTLASDCTGTESDTTGTAISPLVVYGGGDEALGMSLTAGNNVVIHFQRVH